MEGQKLYCAKCGKNIQETNKYCPECGNSIYPYGNNTQIDVDKNANAEIMSFQNIEPTPRKRMNLALRIILCIAWFLVMAIEHAVRKKTGITGIIPNMIEGALMFGVIGYIWKR